MPPVEVRRIALNLDQVRQWGLPPNPAKESDGRFAQYVEETGAAESWELDALSPTIIDALLDQAIRELVDRGSWDLALRQEEREFQPEKPIESIGVSRHYSRVTLPRRVSRLYRLCMY